VQITESLLQQMRDDVVHRRIGAGIARLERLRPELAELRPEHPNAVRFLGYVAQWVDLGFDAEDLLRDLVARVPAAMRTVLPLSAYVQLRVAEGFLAVRDEESDRALRHFEFVLSVSDEVRDPALHAIASFWVARCYRKKGGYEEALQFSVKGEEAALAQGLDVMAAVMRVLESWIIFQKGRNAEAVRLLRESETVLSATDDFITLGNIRSALGRIARREGRYDQALQHFAAAIETYKQRDTGHPNLARSLANMAFVQRLIALDIGRRMDAERTRRQQASERTGAPSVTQKAQKQRLDRLKADALRNLAESLEIHRAHHQYRGAGNVHSIRGALYFDGGELDLAEADALEAYRLGEEKHDYILMARGRILQCMVENGKFEEGIEEHDDPAAHAQAALHYAAEGVAFARHTQNKRLLARALTWHGMTLVNEYFHNPEAARQLSDQAATLVKPDGHHDYVWDELQALNNRLMGAGSVEHILREWSQGLVGEKSFQQISEEFAAILIPKVWEREGRKISRVAQRLAISPKKVRRILAARVGGASEPELI